MERFVTSYPAYQEKHILRAAEFFEMLKPTNKLWLSQNAFYSFWVFRGQGNAEFPMLPSARRAPVKVFLERLIRRYREKGVNAGWPHDVIAVYSQIAAEQQIVYQFAEIADRLGFRIPEYERLKTETPIDHVLGVHDKKKLRPGIAYAIAQHHGIPTQLLDFTNSGLVAAFFAAESADKSMEARQGENSKERSMVVWAINSRIVEEREILDRLDYPRCESPYLFAQDGLFLYDPYAHTEYRTKGTWAPFERLVTQKTLGNDEPTIIKLTLPITESQELLRLLWASGIYRARLMPSLDNIVASVEFQSRWFDADLVRSHQTKNA